MKEYSFGEHFSELKSRLVVTIIFFLIAFILSYYFKEEIFSFSLKPLADSSNNEGRKMIYTGLTEAFFSYVKLALFASFCLTLPVAYYQLYSFIAPGLHVYEKRIASMMLLISPLLFYGGSFFVFYFVMPKAWEFFLSYENHNIELPLILEGRISEYLALVIQLMMSFGLAFQMPIAMIILCIMGTISSRSLKKKRRVAIVSIFIVAAILTPPDVISQIALAIPLFLLYEISIVSCKFLETRRK